MLFEVAAPPRCKEEKEFSGRWRVSRCLPSPGQAAVGNEREEFISTRKHLVSFDSLHRNSGGNSNKQTGQPGEEGRMSNSG